MPMEKQGTVENQLAHTIDQTEYDSRYDRTAKKLLANKQILAQIMKGCVNEYSDCTVDDIVEKYIEGTPEVGSVGVHGQKQTNPRRVAQRQSTVGLNSPSIFICCSFLWVKTELPKAT